MTYALYSCDINSLIYQYMIERGLEHSAFLLKNEAESITEGLVPGSLISYLEKALAMEELETHMNEKEAISNGKNKCVNEFRLNHTHECLYDSIPTKSYSNGSHHELKDFILLSGHTGKINRMIARKGELISAYKLCRSIDGTIRVWRLTQHHHQYQHVFILPHISCNQSPLVVLDVDCNQYAFIASLASDGIVRLWSPDGVLFSTIQYSSKILSVEWDSSGMYILAPYTLGLSIWDSQGILIRNLTNTLISNIQYATWRNSTEFTIQSTSGIWIWRQNEDPVNIFDENIKSVRWNPSKTYLAIIQETQIGIYQDEYDIWWLNPDTTAIQFASKEFLLISGNSYGEIFLWNLESRIIISRLQGNIGKICRIKMRKDDEFLVACSEDEVQVWYLETQTFVRKIKLQGNISDM